MLNIKDITQKYNIILVILSWGTPKNLPKYSLELCNKSLISSYKIYWQRPTNPHCYNETHPHIPWLQGNSHKCRVIKRQSANSCKPALHFKDKKLKTMTCDLQLLESEALFKKLAGIANLILDIHLQKSIQNSYNTDG